MRDMRARIARLAASLGVVLVLGFYAELLAHAPATGQDLRVFYAAATALRDGGNPYDPGQILRTEQRLYHPRNAAERASLAGNPYVQGPPLALALVPLTGQGAATAYHVEALMLLLAALAALALLARAMPARYPKRWTLVLLLSPVTFLGLLLGQPDALLLLLLVAALALYRRHPLPAGFILALGLVKPQIMVGPLILYGLLAWRHRRIGAYLAGVFGGVLVFMSSSAALAGPAIVTSWVRELANFGGATVYTQVDISSLSTLYIAWAPRALGLLLSTAGIVAWAALCLTTIGRDARRAAGSDAGSHAVPGEEDEGERWWLLLGLTGWLLVTPYAHPHDDVLLLPVAWYLLDRGPYRGRARLLALLLLLSWWLLPMTSLLGLRLPLTRGLGIVPVVLLLALLTTLRPTNPATSAMPASPNWAIGPHRIAS